jgi:hypothetical protein
MLEINSTLFTTLIKERTTMSAFTIFHVLLSLIGIGSGFIVLYGLLNSQPFVRTSTVFLTTTVLTSVTGFLFPIHGITPGLVLGALSLIVLACAIIALYQHRLAGGWRRTYVITSVVALYFNVFVLVAQAFQKVPALHDLAPTQSEPPFAVAQGIVLIIFVVLGIRAVKGFHPGLARPV